MTAMAAAILWTFAIGDDSAATARWIDPDTPKVAPPTVPMRIDMGGHVVTMDDPPRLHAASPIHIEVVDADIRGVLRLVSQVSNLNFVVPDHVQSTVTASLEDVPWDLALAAILSAEGLMAVPYSDEIILIEPIPTTR